MSRSIFQRGADYPANIQTIPTFDTNVKYDPTKPQNGLDWQQYQFHCFPWLAFANEENTTLTDPRHFLMTLPDENGGTKPVRIIPKNPEGAININNEMSAILWRQDWETYGVGDLAYVERENGVDFIRLEAKLAPLEQADNFHTLRDSFTVKSVNEFAQTVTIFGKVYYRKRVSTARNADGSPIYEIGNHWGYQRYMRDQLRSDAERNLDDHKVREYDYAFFQWNGDRYRYGSIEDSPTRDLNPINFNTLINALQDTDGAGFLYFSSMSVSPDNVVTLNNISIPNVVVDLSQLGIANQDMLDELQTLTSDRLTDNQFLIDMFRRFDADEVPPSEHTFRMQTWPQGIAPGDTITLSRRLPYVTTMLATCGTFAQVGGIWDFRLRMANKKRQFQAPFLWSNYLQTFTRSYLNREKEVEVDVIEFPGATTPFHNVHRPDGGRDPANYSMINYASRTGVDPVMSNPEWTEIAKQQHQILIPIDSQDYVDHTAWHDIKVVHCLENNPLGFPTNSIIWYVRTNDGRFKFTCGCIMSPDAYNGVLDAFQMFLCNPVDGDFVADMEFFAPGRASTDDTFPYYFDIAHVKVAQFPGHECGGSGFPDLNGQYPQGFRPTPNDITGNSGSGIAGSVPNTPDPETPVLTSGNWQNIVDEYSEIGLRDDGGKLLIPELN